MNTTASDLVSAARSQVRQLSAAEFASEAGSAGTVVVDLRESEELENSGTISGAVHVPRGMLEFRADPSSPYHDDRLQPENPVRLYCASGGRSALAATTLASLGYTDVAHLTGGMKEWIDAGRPVEKPGD